MTRLPLLRLLRYKGSMARRLARWPSPADAPENRACAHCDAIFFRDRHWSWDQWRSRHHCSNVCRAAAARPDLLGRGLKGTTLDAQRHALELSFKEAGVPYGECQCGCGGLTRIAKQSSSRDGGVNGEPVRFLKGHGTRAQDVRRVAALR